MKAQNIRRITKVVFLLLAVFVLVNLARCKNEPAGNGIEMPYNRILRSAGQMLFFGDSTLENHAMDVVLSPDGKFVAVEGRYHIVILDSQTDSILYRFSVRENYNTVNTYSGIRWVEFAGKSTLFWSTRNKVLRSEWNGKELCNTRAYTFPKKGKAKASIPNEIVISENGDSAFMYVVLNGNDQLIKTDIKSGKTIFHAPTGLAPYGAVKVNGKLYVTNWSGTIPSGNTEATSGVPWGWDDRSVDPVNGVVNSGSVSVIDAKSGKVLKEIKTGLHPNDIVALPDGQFVYVANGNDDYVTVINTGTDMVTENITIRLITENNPYFGDSPNGLAISSNGKILYVAAGMDNAVVVVELGEKVSKNGIKGSSRIKGFIPVGAYPGGIAVDEKRQKYMLPTMKVSVPA